MSTKSEISKTSRDPKGSAAGVIEVVPQGEVPGQVVVAVPAEKSKEPAPEFDLGNGMKFSWKANESGDIRPSSKDCRHVLQANGGIIANCYGKKALTLPKHTTFGNRLECILEKQELKEDFILMVGLTLELAEFTESTCPNFTEGFYLTMAQFAEAGVLGLYSLENMPETEVKAALSHVPGRVMGAAMRLGEFLRLNADHGVLKVLGIDEDGLSAVIINNVLTSQRQAKAIPEVFAEKFRKTVPSPSDSTIVHFMDSFNNILTDFGLSHMLTVSDEDLRFGKYHLVDRIISTLLMEKVRKTAAFHCIQGFNMMGMALYREVVKTFFDEHKKMRLHEKVLDELKEIRLLRVSDVHDFFTSAQWFYHFLILLDPVFGRRKFDKILGDCLDKSHTWLQNQKDGDVTFVGLLGRKDELGADKLKDELFKLYTAMKLSGDGLPENFFPSYVSIKAYMKTLDELQSCGKKKREHVQSAESRQKEEAKVRFVETSKKRKADEVAKSEVKPAGEQGSGNGKPFWRNRPKKAKQN
jgi:hypothetical protein